MLVTIFGGWSFLIIFATNIRFWKSKIEFQSWSFKLKTGKVKGCCSSCRHLFLDQGMLAKGAIQYGPYNMDHIIWSILEIFFYDFMSKGLFQFEIVEYGFWILTAWAVRGLSACVRVKLKSLLCFWQISFFFCQRLKRCLREKYYDKKQQEYFLDRHKATFEGLFRKIVFNDVTITSSHLKMTFWLAVTMGSIY